MVLEVCLSALEERHNWIIQFVNANTLSTLLCMELGQSDRWAVALSVCLPASLSVSLSLSLSASVCLSVSLSFLYLFTVCLCLCLSVSLSVSVSVSVSLSLCAVSYTHLTLPTSCCV